MSDLAIQQAAAETILGLTRGDGSSLIPQTILTEAASVGDITLACTDLSRFVKSATFTWWDGTDEPERGILSIDPATNVLTIDYRGLTPGLELDHGIVRIAQNLMLYDPSEVGQYLVKDDPLVIVYCRRQADARGPVRHTLPHYILHIEVVRATVQPQDGEIHPNVYAKGQQDATRSDFGLIKSALLNNQSLNATNGPNAERFGDDSNAPLVVLEWQRLIDSDTDVDRFIAAMDIVVQGLAEPISQR